MSRASSRPESTRTFVPSSRAIALATRRAVAGVAQGRRRDGDQAVGVVLLGQVLERPGGLDGARGDRLRDLALGGDRGAEPQHHALAHDALDAAGRARVGHQQMEGRAPQVEDGDAQLRVRVAPGLPAVPSTHSTSPFATELGELAN